MWKEGFMEVASARWFLSRKDHLGGLGAGKLGTAALKVSFLLRATE